MLTERLDHTPTLPTHAHTFSHTYIHTHTHTHTHIKATLLSLLRIYGAMYRDSCTVNCEAGTSLTGVWLLKSTPACVRVCVCVCYRRGLTIRHLASSRSAPLCSRGPKKSFGKFGTGLR